MHSHQEERFRHDQIRYSNINLSNFNVEDAKTRLISLKSRSELRELPPNQLKLDNSGIQAPVGKDQRAMFWSTIW